VKKEFLLSLLSERRALLSRTPGSPVISCQKFEEDDDRKKKKTILNFSLMKRDKSLPMPTPLSPSKDSKPQLTSPRQPAQKELELKLRLVTLLVAK
jgi:hypothetical protein